MTGPIRHLCPYCPNRPLNIGCDIVVIIVNVFINFMENNNAITYDACQTVHEGRIYQLKLFCGKDYPDNPPSIRFQTRINMTCVNAESGAVRGYTQFLLCHNFKNMGLWLTQLTGGTKSLPNAC